MIELTVKTLDSQNHSYSVPDDISVRRFKEKIATSVGVTADKQRLIYCGRVLQDEKNLAEYDVSGKVIHLVQRPPPSSRSASGAAPNSSANNPNSRPSGAGRDGNSFLLGAFTIPSDVIDPNQVQQIVQQVVSGMGDLGRNATVMSRTSEDGSSVDVHINLGQVPIQSEAQQILNQVQQMIRQAHQVLEQLASPNQDGASAESEAAAAGGPSSGDSPAASGGATASGEACAADSSTSEMPDSTRMETETVEDTVGPSGDVHPVEPTPDTERPHNAAAAAGIAQATRAAAAAAVAAAAGVAGAAAAAVARATGVGIFPHAAASRVPPPQPPETAASDGGSAASGDQSERPTAPPTEAPQAPLPPPTRALAEVISEIQQLQTALQPHLDRYCEILTSEAEFSNDEERNAAQRTFNRVSEVLHYLSHAYHAVSELMVQMNRPVPRRLHANPGMMQHPAAILQAGIPIQAQINLSATNASGGNASSPDSGTATTSNGSPTSQGNQNSSQSSSPPTTSSHQHEGLNVNIPPMAGIFASQSPILLMEVGPGSITIDSISATVVADAAGNQQGTGARGPTMHSMAFPQPPPPEFFQNLMHAVGHTTAQRNANNSQSQARGNTSTNTTTSTQTRSTARPVQPIPINIPGFGLTSFDPYLPCHSRHIYARHFCTAALHNAAAAAAANASSQGQAQGQNQGQAQTGQPGQPAQGANANGQPDVQLSGVITNLMSALLGQPNPYSQGNGAAPATAGPSRTSFPSSPRRAAPAWRRSQVRRFATTRSSAPTNSRAVVDAIIRQQITGNRPQEAASGQSEGSNPENAFSQLFETVGLVHQGNVNNNLFANFLNNFQVDDEPEPAATLEGLISDLFMCITQGMSLQELISTCVGQTEPLDRIRPSLRQYVTQRILRNREATPENINTALDEISALYRSHLQEAASDANVKAGIDYIATMDKYIRHRLHDLIKLVLDDTCESFGATLYILCQFIMSEVIVLNMACFEDGQVSLERVARGRIRALSTDTNQRVEYVLISLFAVNIRHMMSNLTVSEDDVQQFIVRTATSASGDSAPCDSTGAAATTTTTNPFLASAAAASTAEALFSASEPMDTESPAPRNDVSRHDFKRSTAGGGVSSAAGRASTLHSGNAVNGVDDNMVLGQSTWREAIPLEWVPIISKDVQRQRRTTPQPPFSDAYLEGMPSKRRKMMASNKLQVNVDTRSSLSDAVRHSVTAAGVQPLTSLDEVVYDVSENPTVQAAYNEQVRDSIRRRLQSDPDYNPRKFPSSEKYFLPDKEK